MKKSAPSRRAKPRRTTNPQRKAVARKTAKKAPARNPNLEAFGRRFRYIREAAGVTLRQLGTATEIPRAWIARLETTRQDIDPEHFKDWRCILALVSSLRDMCDILDDPRDVYRLVSLLGRPITLDDMRDLCRDVDPEILEQRLWLTWPSTMPLVKQPVVMRQAEWDWLWERVIPTDDAGRPDLDTAFHVDAAVTGAPGVGKSTLVQMFGVSQTVAAHFPDGVLYAS